MTEKKQGTETWKGKRRGSGERGGEQKNRTGGARAAGVYTKEHERYSILYIYVYTNKQMRLPSERGPPKRVVLHKRETRKSGRSERVDVSRR